MSAFERLKIMPDHQIQNWLQIIDSEDLKKAISGIDDNMRKCIYRNMSENARNVLQEIVKNNKHQPSDNQKTIIQKLESVLQGK
jgi:flagellar motor switch protein FliG